MTKREKKLEEVFDIDTDAKLTVAEKENLYKSIIHDATRQTRIRLLSIASVAAVVVGAVIMFYVQLSNESINNFNEIRRVASEHEKQFVSDTDIQIASTKTLNSTTTTETVTQQQEEEGRLTFLPLSNDKGYSTLYIPYGMRKEVLLPDGSTVWLNAGSYLTFKNDFTGKIREVYLNGEGFFDIKKTGNQFIVRTAQADIEVLGTSFNASSYEDDSFFSVELLSGKVRLNSPSSKFESRSMESGERIIIDFDKNTIKSDRNSGGDDVLWTKKQLALKNVTIVELLKRMERIYNVRIHAAKELYDINIEYSGRLNVAVGIEQSLGSIYELKDYNIKLKEKEVFITKKD